MAGGSQNVLAYKIKYYINLTYMVGGSFLVPVQVNCFIPDGFFYKVQISQFTIFPELLILHVIIQHVKY